MAEGTWNPKFGTIEEYCAVRIAKTFEASFWGFHGIGWELWESSGGRPGSFEKIEELFGVLERRVGEDEGGAGDRGFESEN